MLYHYEIGFPAFFTGLNYKGIVRPSHHAIQQALLRATPIPRWIDVSEWQLIELEFNGTEIVKVVLRRKWSDDYDWCIAIAWRDKVVKTIWLNHCKDRHITLNRSKYSTP